MQPYKDDVGRGFSRKARIQSHVEAQERQVLKRINNPVSPVVQKGLIQQLET